MAAERYRAAVRDILAYLAAGDCYQVNLTQPFTAPLAAPAWALLDRLARRHPAPYTAYLDLGDPVVVANSPELLLRRRGRARRDQTHQGHATARRPCRRGTPRCVAELRRDPKERAEHVMIVDLERNDLGRVCEPGSVRVDALARVESHPSAAPSRLRRRPGRCATGSTPARCSRPRFPAGRSPARRRCARWRSSPSSEPSPRGVYTGRARSHRTRDDLELGLPIRTAVVADHHVRWHAGGGIVADSDPERELAEAWLKTAALRLALGETSGAELDRCSSG